MTLIIVYIPCKDDNEAEEISKQLLKKRLIACANIWPARSIYNWRGEHCQENEIVILAKSIKEKEKELIAEIEELHSYELPCIEIFDARANKEYEDWVKQEINGNGKESN